MLLLAILTIGVGYIFWAVHKRKQFTDFMLRNFKSPPIDPLVGHVLRIPLNPPGIFVTIQDWFKNYGKNFALIRPVYNPTLVLSDPRDLEKLLANPNSKTARKADAYFNMEPWLGIFVTIQAWFKNYGKNFALIRPVYNPTLIISDPRDLEKLLANPNSKTARKADAYFNLEPWLGTGLLMSWGEKWFQRRKIITPTFHFNILEGFAEIMCKQSDILVQKLKPMAGKSDIDIYTYTTLFALDVVCETAMGVAVNAQSSPNSEYVQAVKEISTLFQRRFFSVFSQWQLIYDLTPNGYHEKKLRNILHGFTNRVITQRRDQLLNAKPTDDVEGKVRMNFLDMLLKSTISGKPLTNADIREEVDTFMFEGHDTTTSGIAFTFYQLSQHKDIQDRLYEELSDILGDIATSDISYQKLADLRYLDMVVKESLRIAPSVPFIGRKLTEDTVLGGTTIPAGTEISLAIYALHHDPDNYPDPEKFDPERFNPTETTNRHPFAYIPFSAGARNCIGQKFALMEIKLVVAKLVMNFEFLPATKSPIMQGDIILKSASGICVRITDRQKNK